MLFELVADYAATLVLVTHDVELARGCERVLHLHEGAFETQHRAAVDRDSGLSVATVPESAAVSD